DICLRRKGRRDIDDIEIMIARIDARSFLLRVDEAELSLGPDQPAHEAERRERLARPSFSDKGGEKSGVFQRWLFDLHVISSYQCASLAASNARLARPLVSQPIRTFMDFPISRLRRGCRCRAVPRTAARE